MSIKIRFVDLLALIPGLLAIIRGTRFFESLGPDSWQSTDWLISYASGPIRRGLSGTLLRQAATYFPHLQVVKLSLFLTALATLLISIYVTCKSVGISPLRRLALAFSPLIFPMYWLYGPNGGGRKEVFAIFIVMALSILGEIGGQTAIKARNWFACLLLPLLILMHESIFFFAMPFFILSFIINEFISRQSVASSYRLRNAFISLAVIVFPSLLALLFSTIYSKPSAIETLDICISWQSVYPSLSCVPLPSAFQGLVEIQGYLDFVISKYSSPFIYGQWIQAAGYAVLLILSCLCPFIKRHSSNSPSIATTSAASRVMLLLFICIVVGLFNIPLYALSIDYGRWMSVSVSLIVIFVLGHRVELVTASEYLDKILSRFDIRPILKPGLAKFCSSNVPPLFLLYVSSAFVVTSCCMQFFVYDGLVNKLSTAIHVVAGKH